MITRFEAGTSVEEIGRRHDVHANTIRIWRAKYAGMDAGDIARLKQLESENAQMQCIIARQTVKIDAMFQFGALDEKSTLTGYDDPPSGIVTISTRRKPCAGTLNVRTEA